MKHINKVNLEFHLTESFSLAWRKFAEQIVDPESMILVTAAVGRKRYHGILCCW